MPADRGVERGVRGPGTRPRGWPRSAGGRAPSARRPARRLVAADPTPRRPRARSAATTGHGAAAEVRARSGRPRATDGRPGGRARLAGLEVPPDPGLALGEEAATIGSARPASAAGRRDRYDDPSFGHDRHRSRRDRGDRRST
jgi:hypothetical protein